ncbi:MAG: IS6 family transposase [Pseudomonadota bacterium]|nr:IS6 family transposase [Pseudomonadota bacterium]
MISFSSRHYPKFIILQCVRWYVAYALSYRNIEEMMAERGFEIDHATLNRWVLHYTPLLAKKAQKYKRPIHRSWRMDETYIKIKGKWYYLYRAVDKYGATVEFMVSKRRNKAAARAFFRKAFLSNRRPLRINIDKSGANMAALESFNKPGWLTGKKPFLIGPVKYLNNVVEQDHRHIKRITNPMGCFRKMHTASRTLAGIELMNMIKKKQLKFTKYRDQNLSPAEQFYRLATVR